MAGRFFKVLPVVALVLAAWISAVPQAFARVQGGAVRLGIHEEGVTRFVMDLSDSLEFRVHTLADPYRVVVEAPALAWSSGSQLRKPFGSVRGLSGEDGRVVLELKNPAAVAKAFLISPRDGMGWRFVVDLKDTTRDAFLATAEKAPKPQPKQQAAAPAPAAPAPAAPAPAARPPEPRPVAAAPPPPAPEPPPAPSPRSIVVVSPNAQPQPPPAVTAPPPARPLESRTVAGAPMLSGPMPPPPERPQPAVAAVPAIEAPPPVAIQPAVVAPPANATLPPPPAFDGERKRNDGPPVVVIDPGHGGVDPGAIGVSGVYEKHITLAVARELKESLEKAGRYRVYLTRDRDVFIRLRDRIAIARQYNADLFISLHADAVQNPQIKGLSVYTLSQNASDAEAQALAEKENKADLIAGIDLSHESADVANILIDLAQRETMNRSAGFAAEIVDEVGREQVLLGNTHRFAGFAVLKAPDVPAVLVEMGYLSNEAEERDLRQPQYRAKLAKSVARAVDRFFLQAQKAKRP